MATVKLTDKPMAAEGLEGDTLVLIQNGTVKRLPLSLLAAAEPPQKLALPLAGDWVRVNAAEYWRTQEGVVTVTFRVAKPDGAAIEPGTHMIATLPEGFRPVGYTPHTACSAVNSVGQSWPLWVDLDGSVRTAIAVGVDASPVPEPYNWPGFAATLTFLSKQN